MSQPPYPSPSPYPSYPSDGSQEGSQPTNGLAIASLVIGGVTIVLSVIPFLNLVGVVVALVGLGLGVGGLFHARRHGNGRGMSWAGVVLCSLAVVVSITVTVLVTQDIFGWLDNSVSTDDDRSDLAPPDQQ